MKQLFLCLFVLVLASSCQKVCDEFNPDIVYFSNPITIASRPSAFSPLISLEARSDWGKEVKIAYAFAKEQDYYRAITAFKRALVFLPVNLPARKLQIEYAIFHCYYLAYKYEEAIEAFQGSSLECVTGEFCAYRELLIQLYECYCKCGNETDAERIFSFIERDFPEDAETLKITDAVLEANFPALVSIAECREDKEDLEELITCYSLQAKSEDRARLYQTLLPGAGYYYVGQKQAALTSLIINTLFVWAAYRCFKTGNTAAGILTASLESGWYFGGINGAGIAAREYNERLYHTLGRDFLRNKSYFPVLMLETTF